MSRWHRASCSAPVIVVEQQIPTCKSCNASPDLHEIVSAQAAERISPSAIPPDEPPGQLNLWWPPCVPYTPRSPSALLPNDGAELISAAPADDSLGGADDSQHDFRTSVYPLQLQPDQLRLLRLSSVENVDSPVHVDLEIHDDQRHPEYETKMATAHLVDRFMLVDTGTFLFKPRTAGRCSDTSVHGETYERSGWMLYASISMISTKERTR
ncbi:heterokaryon incompatibility protein het-6-like protein [Colletotrichum chrysophilum]|uniref:Heterokaryon incompatibility protein het-6-like protein n=1 Tax=Colletotrichum chrysophilum TaxID=1836956 RepID=A0AAD9EP53_9PEZI|nr:heterokaryon incompatibility protein het-6-like protein [Colletotrichum chrysophilum]